MKTLLWTVLYVALSASFGFILGTYGAKPEPTPITSWILSVLFLTFCGYLSISGIIQLWQHGKNMEESRQHWFEQYMEEKEKRIEYESKR